MRKPHETLNALQQIRSKLNDARTLSRSLGTPEEPYDLQVTLDTIIMGLDAQIGALKNAGEPHGVHDIVAPLDTPGAWWSRGVGVSLLGRGS